MAGMGSRFSRAGYSRPKPMITVGGKLMISIVLNNLSSEKLAKVVIVSRQAILRDLTLQPFVPENLRDKVVTVGTQDLPNGPAESVLIAKDYIDEQLPVVVANTDQFVLGGIESFYDRLLQMGSGGILITSRDSDPKWSFVEFSENGEVVGVREKSPVSDVITVGVYGFDNFNSFSSALQIAKLEKDTVMGEYFVGPLYNYLVSKTWKLRLHPCGELGREFFGIGTPKDLKEFIAQTDVLQSSTDFTLLPSEEKTYQQPEQIFLGEQ